MEKNSKMTKGQKKLIKSVTRVRTLASKNKLGGYWPSLSNTRTGSSMHVTSE